MKISDCLRILGPLAEDFFLPPGTVENTELRGVANSSSSVEKGFLFCAIKGSRTDGHQYLPDAVRRGAVLLVLSSSFPHPPVPGASSSSSPCPDGIPWIRVTDSYDAWARICAEYFGNPGDALEIHGITGTNGKTSTAFLLRHFLNGCCEEQDADSEKNGKNGESHGKSTPSSSCALLSTILTDTGKGCIREASGTTPDAWNLQRLFLEAKNNSCRALVMETSSHGLSQHRPGTTKFCSGIFTNLTGDHLDYHKSMEAYYQAKKILFSEMLRKNAVAVINIDDEWGERLSGELCSERPDLRILDLSGKKSDAFCFIRDFTLSANGTDISVILDGQHLSLHSPLIGTHNVWNILSAMTAAYGASGISLSLLQTKLRTAPAAPGRLQHIRLGNGALAFVDYAHTDDALFRVLSTLRQLIKGNGKILTLFGCGGDRDRTKRPRMGKVASEFSDILILTSDNPRSESPDSIIREILQGVPHDRRDCFILPDRAEAICKAVSLASEGDLILVAGKGHETTQEIQGVRYHFDDMEELEKFKA